MDFINWLLDQIGRDDPVGDVAAEVLTLSQQPGFPFIDGSENQIAYLEENHFGGHAFSCCKAEWEDVQLARHGARA